MPLTNVKLIRLLPLTLLVLVGVQSSALAQEVTIPDPGLNTAIQVALQKPFGPLTQQDMLSLTNLNANRRNVKSIVGLEAARNLVSLDLSINRLTNFALPNQLTNVSTLDLSANPLTNVFLPNALTKLTSLTIEGAELTSLTLPATLRGLTNLDLEGNAIASFDQLSNLTSLVALDLGFNSFTNFSLPGGLTNLSTFYFAGNPLTNIALPPGQAAMTELNVSQNLLTRFTLPAGMTNLIELNLAFNQLTNVILPGDLRNLIELDLDFNRLSVLNFPSNLNKLAFLHLRANLFTNFTLPAGLTGLSYLDVSDGPLSSISLPTDLKHLTSLRIAGNTSLTSLILPAGMTNLTGLFLVGNHLTNLVLPSDLNRLDFLNVGGNRLTSLTLPAGLTNLTGLFVVGNLLTNLTLPPDLTHLVAFSFLSNPLTTLVLSELLAGSTNLTVNLETIDALPNQGVSVFTYPLVVQLVQPRPSVGAFQFEIIGPPGDYTVLASTNVADWSPLGTVANPLGSVVFTDVTAQLSPRKFYRAQLQRPPSNMVFVSPNTFILGSPTNEVGHQSDESPQTVVTLTHGFWIAKFPVTQREYLAVTGSNPSGFPGDLDRPVETVSWFAASNYCTLLTQQDMAAGRIPSGSHYRLPTEAEWECAARAGTSTRFYYGNDPTVTSLANHAWYGANGGIGTHPVGQKEPNAWGLYDMEGNVWEWCQDWYGPYPGGNVTDPQGPASNPIGFKVIRGGAWEAFELDCRSARRSIEGASPFITDFIIGFRVVLAFGP